MGDVFSNLMQPETLDSPVQVLSERYELWARVVRNGLEIADHAALFSRQHNDTPEYRWISHRIREAALSLQPEFGQGTLLLIREVTGGIVLDDERTLESVAPWMPSNGG